MSRLKGFLRSGQFWFTLATVILLVVGVLLSVAFWEWLRDGTYSLESRGTTIRNLGLLIGGAITLVFAIWRSLVAERQADAAQRQADTAQQELLNERYQKGAEMLGSNFLSVRLGGIYALRRPPRSIQSSTTSRSCACLARSSAIQPKTATSNPQTPRQVRRSPALMFRPSWMRLAHVERED